jgi:hypothetical protein
MFTNGLQLSLLKIKYSAPHCVLFLPVHLSFICSVGDIVGSLSFENFIALKVFII